MKEYLIFGLAILKSVVSLAQNPQFSCPIPKGKIQIYHHSTEAAINPGATFRNKNSTVYNIIEGTVNSIDTVSGLINVNIESGEFFFSYYGFRGVTISNGQKLLQGDPIGKIKRNKNLFLIMSFKGELVEPLKYLKCKSVDVWL